MKKTWFYRLLFSYFPIFFSLTSVLILLAFLFVSDLSRKETMNANQMYVRHVIQMIDHSLRETDGMLIHEIETNDKLRTFFQRNAGSQNYFSTYEVSKKINELVTFNTFIDSVYLYRFSDGMVISPAVFVPLEKFGDRTFLTGHLDSRIPYTLSERRIYSDALDPENRPPASVVSIVRRYPLLTGEQGVVVINIAVREIQKMLASMSSSQVSFVEIKDRNGNLITDPLPENKGKEGTVLSRFVSDYTGWSYEGGVYDNHLFRYASVFSYLWIVSGFVVVAAGTIWMAYVTRRNYKPIESIISRINVYSMHKSSKLTRKAKDEFNFIEQALDNLIEQSNTYQKLHEEDVIYRRRHFFLQLLEGRRPANPRDWATELELFWTRSPGESIGLAVFEIDKYSAMKERYSVRDQYLLKFVLNSVVKEIAEPLPVTVWPEWTADHRLTVLFQMVDAQNGDEQFIASLAESVRAWVEKNLDYTVTVGVGPCMAQVDDIPHSYAGALAALAYKSSLGLNLVIPHNERGLKLQGEPYRHLQLIRSLAQAFRAGGEDWRSIYSQIFSEVKDALFSREEHVNLMNYFIYHLYREMMEFPPNVREIWKTETLPRLNQVLHTFDLVDEVETQFLDILTDTEKKIRLLQESRSKYTVIREVRSYIEREYANPDLSLNLLCEEFGLNGKYLSRLFKEAFGVKLVDYLVGVKVEKSKELLENTQLSLQQISGAVGYLHVISFIRAFKKVEGTTPGEYRKKHGKSLS
ncbi:helix-turn-helix domain-containing protein [Paenibacillus elgii]|uniref:helix-turn-helix domain-containing protein n=1 Tax=Paenibacillus elgii TaxID=189691 RepID=UPI000FDA01A2|nr:helix-turn-helix domain-containing protein [Paenibacillus elgii]NEN87094.1 helix-turn-helix domain-containing protein [Paenibacillus elgii]